MSRDIVERPVPIDPNTFAALQEKERIVAWRPISDLVDIYTQPLWIASPDLIDGDANPLGIADGYWQDDEGWKTTRYCMQHDEWHTITLPLEAVTHFMIPIGPFSEADAIENNEYIKGTECHNCNAVVWADTEAEAIAAWNTRIQAQQQPAASEPVADEIERLLRLAYQQGAYDVHENWREDRDPDFSEAAYDYVAGVDLTPLYAHPAPVASEGLVEALLAIATMGYAGAPDIEMRRIARTALASLQPNPDAGADA